MPRNAKAQWGIGLKFIKLAKIIANKDSFESVIYSEYTVIVTLGLLLG